MIQEIQQWLDSKRDYAAGVAIAGRHSKRNALKSMLALGETDFNREKLLEELIRLNREVAAEPRPKPAMEILSDGEYQRAPVEVKALKNRATDLNKLNGRRHAQLATWLKEARENWPGQPDHINAYLQNRSAGDLANQILDTDDELAGLYFQIDYWRIHGRIPEDLPNPKLPFMEKFELKQQLQNVRSRISKLKNRYEKRIELQEAIAYRDRLEEAINQHQ